MKKVKEVSSLEYTSTVEFTAEEVKAILVAKAGGKKAEQVISTDIREDGSAVVKLLFVKK